MRRWADGVAETLQFSHPQATYPISQVNRDKWKVNRLSPVAWPSINVPAATRVKGFPGTEFWYVRLVWVLKLLMHTQTLYAVDPLSTTHKTYKSSIPRRKSPLPMRLSALRVFAIMLFVISFCRIVLFCCEFYKVTGRFQSSASENRLANKSFETFLRNKTPRHVRLGSEGSGVWNKVKRNRWVLLFRRKRQFYLA